MFRQSFIYRSNFTANRTNSCGAIRFCTVSSMDSWKSIIPDSRLRSILNDRDYLECVYVEYLNY